MCLLVRDAILIESPAGFQDYRVFDAVLAVSFFLMAISAAVPDIKGFVGFNKLEACLLEGQHNLEMLGVRLHNNRLFEIAVVRRGDDLSLALVFHKFFC